MIAVQLIAATLAFAAPAVDEPREALSAPASSSGQSAQASSTRYCVVDSVTGTRIERKMCRTRAEWLQEGYDPLAAK